MHLKKLIEGYKQFHRDYYKDDPAVYEKLVKEGQAPEVLMVACSDSRTDPALVTNSMPGDLFVVRNVAAIIPPYEQGGGYHGVSAAIEFAVRSLEVSHIVVLGHALCGGALALANRETTCKHYEFLENWISIGAPALQEIETELKDAGPEIKQRALEQALVVTSLKNLMTFPWVAEKVESGKIILHGWYFDIQSGKLMEFDPDTHTFKTITSHSVKGAVGLAA